MIGGDEASRTAHVSCDNRRLSGNMFTQMSGHKAGIDVGGARRGIPDDEVDGLAAIERFDGLSTGGSGCEDKDRKSKSACQPVAMAASPESADVPSQIAYRADFHVRHHS